MAAEFVLANPETFRGSCQNAGLEYCSAGKHLLVMRCARKVASVEVPARAVGKLRERL
jgi:hypothetical protein